MHIGLQNQKGWNIQSKISCSGTQPSTRCGFHRQLCPVVRDVTFRIALARMMMEDLDCMPMDVETAFLYGEIEEEIYMEAPVGMKEVLSNQDETDKENTCYQLLKGIYGLFQSARLKPKSDQDRQTDSRTEI